MLLLFSIAYKSISLEPALASTSKALQRAEYLTQNSEISAKKEGEMTMVSAERLAQMAKKWQRMAALGRKRLTSMMSRAKGADVCSASVAVKGHFVMYTADGSRFEVPLAYLGSVIIGELLRVSHDEFGFTSDGRITLCCNAVVMEYVMCLLRRNASEEVEKAFLSSVVRPCHYGNGLEPSSGLSQQLAVSSF